MVGVPGVVAVYLVDGLVDGEEEFGVVLCSGGLVVGLGVGVAVGFEEGFDGGDDFVGDVFVEFFASEVGWGGGWLPCVGEEVDGSEVSCCGYGVFAVDGDFGDVLSECVDLVGGSVFGGGGDAGVGYE